MISNQLCSKQFVLCLTKLKQRQLLVIQNWLKALHLQKKQRKLLQALRRKELKVELPLQDPRERLLLEANQQLPQLLHLKSQKIVQ